MRKFVIVSGKKWNEKLLESLKEKIGGNWTLMSDKSSFSNLKDLMPDKIFIPHWSHIIPAEIYENYECIVFHMTDLPYGRGGSPLQNLIERGHDKTKISALKVEKGLDTGDIYLKKELTLLGTAEEIFIRANRVIEEMIIEIIKEDLKPVPQEGEIVEFRRRKPEQSDISCISSLEKIFDHIRMLDAEGYPKAYIETDFFKIEFSRASLKSDETIIADVKISKK